MIVGPKNESEEDVRYEDQKLCHWDVLHFIISMAASPEHTRNSSLISDSTKVA